MQKAGYTFIREELNLLVPPLGMELAKGNGAKDKIVHYGVQKYKLLSKNKVVGSSISEHIETAIKYQGIRLAYLSPIFEKIDTDELTTFIKEREKSTLRRCIWFLYEWLTDKKLDIPDSNANYPIISWSK